MLAVAYILTPKHGTLLGAHLTHVLLFTLVINAVRDILPLLFKNRTPVDAEEGVFRWFELALLFMAAIALPLITPRSYVPYDINVRLDHHGTD